MVKVIFRYADELLKSVSIDDGHTILRAAKQGRALYNIGAAVKRSVRLVRS